MKIEQLKEKLNEEKLKTEILKIELNFILEKNKLTKAFLKKYK